MGLRNYYRWWLKKQSPMTIQFDHLYGEYQTIKIQVQKEDRDAAEYIEKDLVKKKTEDILTWNDLYYFDLILANFYPFEKLRSKVIRLRRDYRSIAGQKEFDDYMASKPPDLQSLPDFSNPPPTMDEYKDLLREDLKDLLGRVYLRYAILPIREARLNILTIIAAGLCLSSLIILLGFILYLLFFKPDVQKSGILTVLVVFVSGAMGGFVSALQRIQSPINEGDPLYNLSLLYYGSYTVFVAPITGASFAILLYLMFTSQVLSGTFFPTIYTPRAEEITLAQPQSPETQNSNSSESNSDKNTSPAQTNTNINISTQPNLNTNTATATNSTPTRRFFQQNSSDNSKPTPSPSPSPTSSPTPAPVPKKSMYARDFLEQSGPAGGKDYALLIIWCFIAGFAERFVPDAIDRLISKRNAANSGNT